MAARPAVLLLAVELILFSASNSAGCKQALGLQDGGIKNEAITASSWKDDNHKPQFARLNSEKAWCSGNETSPYLQISLSEVHKITGIATQGSLRDKQWVTEYEIHYTTNASGWKVHKASNGKQIFQGNSHFQRTSRHKFCVPLIANAIRIFPTKAISRSSGFTEFCLRVEIYGCKEVTCEDPGVPTHGKQAHVSNNYRFGGSVIFACDASYKLVGNKAITCLEDKSWSGKAPQCVGLCSDPGQPKNGIRMDHNFSFGQVVRFRCNPYFLRKGPRAIKCQSGKWDGPVPQCVVIDCGSLPAPANGKKISETKTTYQGEVVFECEKIGYELKGPKIRYCQKNGEWSGSRTTCEAVSCGDPGTPSNGRQEVVTKNYRYSGTVTFGCATNYTLIGNKEIICRYDKSWTGNIPRCAAPCQDPGHPENGTTVSNGFIHGQSVQFECIKGFLFVGAKSSKCQDGRWSNSVPKCFSPCLDPGTPDNGRRRSSNRNFEHNNVITFTCDRGYDLKGANDIKCQNGQWSSIKPRCEVKACPAPLVPSNMRISRPLKLPSSFQLMQRVMYACKPGYYRYQGSPIRECGITGEWSKLTQICRPKTCGDPKTPINGKKHGYEYTFGKRVHYSCDNGFKLVGSKYRNCQSNQVWSGSLPKCKVVDCGSLPAPANGKKISETKTTYQGEVVFECEKIGYELKGPKIRYCQTDGEWSGSRTTCEAVSCGDPGTPSNGRQEVVTKNYRYSGTVTFGCAANYTLIGNKEIICRHDKSWTGNIPRCAAPCQDPGHPENGTTVSNGFIHGQSVQFECLKGFLFVGAKSSKCQNGRWGNSVPKCFSPCLDPGTPDNGRRRSSNRNFEHNNVITFTCDRGYELKGANDIKCQNGQWSSTKPRCEVVNCGDPGVPSHGKQVQVTNNFNFGGSVVFACDASYNLVGSRKITCQQNKSWSGTLPQCVQLCSDPGQPKSGVRMDNNFSFGQIVRFRCNPYLLRKGPRAIKCQNGKWDGPVPQCSECAAPVQHVTREDQPKTITLKLREAALITGLKLKMKANAGPCQLYLKLQVPKEQKSWRTVYEEGGSDKVFPVKPGTPKHFKFNEPFIAQGLKLKCSGKKKLDLESVTLVGCEDLKGTFDCILVGSKIWVREKSANNENRTVYQQEYVYKIQNQEVVINRGGPLIAKIVPDIIASRNMLTHGTRVIAKDGETFYSGTVKGETENSQWKIESQGVVWTSDLNNIRIIEQPKYCAA